MAVERRVGWSWPAPKPCPETLALGVVCLLDLVTTVILIAQGQGVEGNPLMAVFLRYGIGALCAAKLLFVVPPLLIAEWYRQYNDHLVRRMLRATTIAYVLVWAVGFFSLNPHLLRP